MLVQFEKILTFTELGLLFIKLFSHENLAFHFRLFLILALDELLQDSVLVQGCPLIDLILKPADNACPIIVAEVLSEAFA